MTSYLSEDEEPLPPSGEEPGALLPDQALQEGTGGGEEGAGQARAQHWAPVVGRVLWPRLPLGPRLLQPRTLESPSFRGLAALACPLPQVLLLRPTTLYVASGALRALPFRNLFSDLNI